MANTKVKMVRLIVARSEIDRFLKDLILLGCIEVFDPDYPPEEAVPAPFLRPVILDLDKLDANRDSLTLLGTEYTLILSGWLPARSEHALVTMLADYSCAWEIEAPTPENRESAPVVLSFPKFFGKLRLGGRRLLNPLERSLSKPEAGVPE